MQGTLVYTNGSNPRLTGNRGNIKKLRKEMLGESLCANLDDCNNYNAQHYQTKGDDLRL